MRLDTFRWPTYLTEFYNIVYENMDNPVELAMRVSAMSAIRFMEDVKEWILQSDFITHAAASPGFTPQMLNVADRLFKTEYELVNRLNAIMEPAGLTKVYHLSEAINGADNKFMSVAEKDALELALDTFFTEVAGDRALDCRQQWHICINWTRMRIAVAHPRSCSNPSTRTQRLRQIHHSIQHEEEYELVREAAMAMTACLARMWNTCL